MESLKINIPEGYVIDTEKSNLGEGEVVFKKKGITYKDVAKELFLSKEGYYINDCGLITQKTFGPCSYKDEINCASKEQAEKLLAINQLMNVAKYLNDGWTPNWENKEPKFYIRSVFDGFNINTTFDYNGAAAYFKTSELARQAINILGKETIRKCFQNY